MRLRNAKRSTIATAWTVRGSQTDGPHGVSHGTLTPRITRCAEDSTRVDAGNVASPQHRTTGLMRQINNDDACFQHTTRLQTTTSKYQKL